MKLLKEEPRLSKCCVALSRCCFLRTYCSKRRLELNTYWSVSWLKFWQQSSWCCTMYTVQWKSSFSITKRDEWNVPIQKRKCVSLERKYWYCTSIWKEKRWRFWGFSVALLESFLTIVSLFHLKIAMQKDMRPLHVLNAFTNTFSKSLLILSRKSCFWIDIWYSTVTYVFMRLWGETFPLSLWARSRLLGCNGRLYFVSLCVRSVNEWLNLRNKILLSMVQGRSWIWEVAIYVSDCYSRKTLEED